MDGAPTRTNDESTTKRALEKERLMSLARSSQNIPLKNPEETPAETEREETQNAPESSQTSRSANPQSLRKTLGEARALAKNGKTASATADGAAQAVSQMASARFLSLSWISLAPSFGLTLFYINFHFFMAHMLKNKRFCKFGEEWTPKVGGVSQGMGGYLGPLEILGMFVFDVFFALLLGSTLFFLMLIVRYMQTLGNAVLPTDFLIDIWSNAFSLIDKLFSF